MAGFMKNYLYLIVLYVITAIWFFTSNAMRVYVYNSLEISLMLPLSIISILYILYFAGISLFADYQGSFNILTITGGVLLGCDINRIVNYFKLSDSSKSY